MNHLFAIKFWLPSWKILFHNNKRVCEILLFKWSLKRFDNPANIL